MVMQFYPMTSLLILVKFLY
uniref:Uncharacterized protein n=1 Tax=Anguilla anguilla TaxID=7936 RepID=A0A0E9UJZ2_ANGAN